MMANYQKDKETGFWKEILSYPSAFPIFLVLIHSPSQKLPAFQNSLLSWKSSHWNSVEVPGQNVLIYFNKIILRWRVLVEQAASPQQSLETAAYAAICDIKTMHPGLSGCLLLDWYRPASDNFPDCALCFVSFEHMWTLKFLCLVSLPLAFSYINPHRPQPASTKHIEH